VSNPPSTLEAKAPLDYATPRADVAGRFHQLDGLRAVAVSLVLLHHSFTNAVAGALLTVANETQQLGRTTLSAVFFYLADLVSSITASGVELFFVLSGIVLLRPYLRGVRAFDIASYFRRRAQRLWPPYLVALVAEGLVLWVMTTWPTWYSAERPEKFSVLGWASQLGILNLGWDMYNVAWWSLTIELIFYLVAPLLVPVFASRAMTRLAFVIVMVLSFCGAALIYASADLKTRDLTQAFLNFGVYLPCFLFGLAIAKYDVPRRVGQYLIFAGAFYILLATRVKPMNVHAGFGLLYAGLTVLAFDVGGAWTRFLSSRLMVWLGERSYSLFLIHFTVFAGTNYLVSWMIPTRSATYFGLTRLIGVPGAVLAAMVIFHVIERRFARNLLTDKDFWPPLWRPHRAGGR
jgi:peptidoglycan/LPS O-acetylase OafA/YrhL